MSSFFYSSRKHCFTAKCLAENKLFLSENKSNFVVVFSFANALLMRRIKYLVQIFDQSVINADCCAFARSPFTLYCCFFCLRPQTSCMARIANFVALFVYNIALFYFWWCELFVTFFFVDKSLLYLIEQWNNKNEPTIILWHFVDFSLSFLA